MKAVTWHGNEDIRVDNVDDPAIEEPTDAIIRVTSSGICGSDLHLCDPLGVDAFATHHLPLEEAAQAYEIFQKKEDNAFKILLEPGR